MSRLPFELSKQLKTHWLSFDQYIREISQKNQIVIHHSAGWDNARGMIDGWNKSRSKVATFCGITDDGSIYQAFSSKYWAWHIGLRAYTPNKANFTYAHARQLEKESIGIEICNWGNLEYRDGKFISWAGAEVPESKVIEYPELYRGHRFYERYTYKEIRSLEILLKYLSSINHIPLRYDDRMWDICKDAQLGKPGVWSHTSYRPDKVDVHPQPELIEMLKGL